MKNKIIFLFLLFQFIAFTTVFSQQPVVEVNTTKATELEEVTTTKKTETPKEEKKVKVKPIMPLNFGLSVAGNFNMHTQDMHIRSIYTFTENAYGYGPAGGLICNIPVGRNFAISTYAGYQGFFADANTDDGLSATSMKSQMHYIEFDVAVRYYGLFENLERFYFTAGVDFSIPLKTEVEFIGSGYPAEEIPEAALRPAVLFGVGHSFKVTENSYLTPSLTYRFPLTEVSDNVDFQSWTIPQLRLGLDWTFSFEKPEPEPEPIFVPELKTGFKQINFYQNDGTIHPLEKIKVEEVRYKELFPLVPYVFCDIEKATPPAKFQNLASNNPAGDFSVTSLSPNAIEINKSVLDIIGTRMQKNKNARLNINGTMDTKSESIANKVDEKRAAWAKNYLVSTYQIDPNRIIAKGIGSPTKPSSSRVEDGKEENRRIELYSDNPDLLQPIEIEKEKTRIAEPAYIEFLPFIYSNEEIVEWELEILQGGKVLRKNTGSGVPDSILWNIYPNELAASEIPVDYRFSAQSLSGLESYSDGSIPVEYFSYNKRATEQQADSTVSKFSLIVFDFDSPDISVVDQQILLKNVVPAISHKSVVKIYGYSDRIGEEGYNQKLALQRAENVRQILQAKASNVRYEVYGVGENIQIFDNNLPVGRQLSRTVQIYVITSD